MHLHRGGETTRANKALVLSVARDVSLLRQLLAVFSVAIVRPAMSGNGRLRRDQTLYSSSDFEFEIGNEWPFELRSLHEQHEIQGTCTAHHPPTIVSEGCSAGTGRVRIGMRATACGGR